MAREQRNGTLWWSTLLYSTVSTYSIGTQLYVTAWYQDDSSLTKQQQVSCTCVYAAKYLTSQGTSTL